MRLAFSARTLEAQSAEQLEFYVPNAPALSHLLYAGQSAALCDFPYRKESVRGFDLTRGGRDDLDINDNFVAHHRNTFEGPAAELRSKFATVNGAVVTSHRVDFSSLFSNFTWSVIGFVTPCMVKSPRISPAYGAVCFTLRLVNVISGNFAALKNSSLRKWVSRFAIPGVDALDLNRRHHRRLLRMFAIDLHRSTKFFEERLLRL